MLQVWLPPARAAAAVLGPYVHRIAPVLAKVGGVYLWWYGLGYTLGFLQIFLVLRRRRQRLGLSRRDVYTLTLVLVTGVLAGGRTTHRLALGTGQTLDIAMALVGSLLLHRSRRRRLGRLGTLETRRRVRPAPQDEAPLPGQRLALAALLLFCLAIPSNWTQDVPARYGRRHPGLVHSWLYPRIDTAPPAGSEQRPPAAPAPAIGPASASPGEPARSRPSR